MTPFGHKSEVVLPTTLSAAGSNPLDRRGLTRLALVDELPPLCLQHGRETGDRFAASITFCGTAEYQSAAVFWRGLGRRLGRRGYLPGMGGPQPQADAILDVSLPTCRRCRLRVGVFQFLCLAMVFVGLLMVIGALASAQQGATHLVKYFAFGIFPGWIPVGLLLTVLFFNQARPAWRARRTEDRGSVAFHAHPRFLERIAANTDG
ncbi:hypothetical protein [Nocardia sp. SSK8]|uniref:hypothetical protein n=1 Tax=Nocardia sp. SSK8 TaxID=3120154 RepID=UPI00300ABB58